MKNKKILDTFTVLFEALKLLRCLLQSSQGIILPPLRLANLGAESSFGDLAPLTLCLKLGLLSSQLGLQEIHLGGQFLFNFARAKKA